MTKRPRKTSVELDTLGDLYFLPLAGTQSRSKEVLLDILKVFLAFLEAKLGRDFLQMFVLLSMQAKRADVRGLDKADVRPVSSFSHQCIHR